MDMDMVIVTVKSQEGKQLMDLEVPFDITAQELSTVLANYLQINEISALRVEHLKRVLMGSETLKEAGVWEGSFIVIEA